jgi:3-phytase
MVSTGPNNVDVEYGLALGGRGGGYRGRDGEAETASVFAIARDSGRLTDASSGGGLPVFEGCHGEEAAPMGIALYRRPRDGAIFAVVGRKTGPRQGYLWQYRLEDEGRGKVKGVKVRESGAFSGSAEIEAIAVDDTAGYVYYADEADGIPKWHADPDHPDASRELAHFGRTGFQADREGIAIYARADGTVTLSARTSWIRTAVTWCTAGRELRACSWRGIRPDAISWSIDGATSSRRHVSSQPVCRNLPNADRIMRIAR